MQVVPKSRKSLGPPSRPSPTDLSRRAAVSLGSHTTTPTHRRMNDWVRQTRLRRPRVGTVFRWLISEPGTSGFSPVLGCAVFSPCRRGAREEHARPGARLYADRHRLNRNPRCSSSPYKTRANYLHVSSPFYHFNKSS